MRPRSRGHPRGPHVPGAGRSRAPARGDVRHRRGGCRTRRTSSRRRSRPCAASTAGSAAPAWARSTSGASLRFRPAGRAPGAERVRALGPRARAGDAHRRRRRLWLRPRRDVAGAAGRRGLGPGLHLPCVQAIGRACASARACPPAFLWANLTELRSVLVTGALLARQPGPRVVLARHVADATDATGRAHLLRLARMVAGRSGRLYLQVQTARTPGNGERGVKTLDVEPCSRRCADLGGRVLERHRHRRRRGRRRARLRRRHRPSADW